MQRLLLIAAAKAEIAQLQADAKTEIAEAKTGDAMNLKAAAEKRGLEGERDDDGNFITEEKGSALALAKAAAESESSSETGEHGSGMDLTGQNKAAGNIPTEEMIEEEIPVHPAIVQQIEEDDIPVEEDDIETDERTDAKSERQKFMGIDREQGRT